ncbi:MAG: Ubiquitin carboxyl-terminal hydrolase 3 [Chaenotheca gracillima]|nr:MAG: Ubiquitin carboxyl-terminal hydrolase 3 [Chaenotheca gracillima]
MSWSSLLAMFMLALSVSSQSFTVSNDTASNATDMKPDQSLYLKTLQGKMNISVQVDPLTTQAGAGMSPAQMKSIMINGTLILINTQNYPSVLPSDIAYMSCDNSTYSSGNIDATRVFTTVASHSPAAIVLYSAFSNRCNIIGPSPFDNVYTMVDKTNATSVEQELRSNSLAQVLISAGQNITMPGANNTDDNGGGNILGPPPTTAVAMIILYSITGVITALFLIIIVTGAIRAHRHPERYGPRQALLGRARQSRAKGIARAMLETIPIVKFGDNEEDKAAAGDVELADGQTSEGRRTDSAATRENGSARSSAERARGADVATASTEPTETTHGSSSQTAEDNVEGAAAVDTAAASEAKDKSAKEAKDAKDKAAADAAARDDGLGCSICTEDFIKGEDIRVLPCNHKFHPECVDPWLLNVSGTCPLCRIDLRPKPEAAEGEEGQPSAEGTSTNPENMPPPLLDPVNISAAAGASSGGSAGTPRVHNETDTRRRRRLSWFATHHPGLTPQSRPEERMAALRTYREQARAQEDDRRRSRLSGLFNSLHIRTTRGAEASAAPTPPSEPAAPSAPDNPTSDASRQ